MYKLSATAIKSLPVGKYNDGAGLWLFKRSLDSGQWVLRVTVFGRRREMGLGSLRTVSLKQARESASHWRSVANEGKDPVWERQKQVQISKNADHTLAAIAIETFEARKAELKGDGKAGRWFSPLENHILPKLGKTPVEYIHQVAIKEVLQPIWHTKADVAKKALNRLGIVLKFAAASGFEVDLQAVDKAKQLLGKSRHSPSNIPSMPWREVPAFYQSLNELSVSHLALRLLILTGSRSGPIRMLKLNQIDGDVWTVPGEMMKGQKDKTPDFRIPLSAEALKVVKAAMPFERGGFLFAAPRKGVLSDATMARLMQRRGMIARPHGFRSSLRVWLAEETDAGSELSEMILAHRVGTKVSRAYQRSDMIEQRRNYLNRWSEFLLYSM